MQQRPGAGDEEPRRDAPAPGVGERHTQTGRGSDEHASPQVGIPEGGSSTDDPREAERYGV